MCGDDFMMRETAGERRVDGAGITRLVELDVRGLPAATVSHTSARIGDGRSMWDSGVLSHLNRSAEQAGARPGMRAPEFAALFAN